MVFIGSKGDGTADVVDFLLGEVLDQGLDKSCLSALGRALNNDYIGRL